MSLCFISAYAATPITTDGRTVDALTASAVLVAMAGGVAGTAPCVGRQRRRC